MDVPDWYCKIYIQLYKGAGKVLQILRSYIKYGKKGLNDIQIVLLPFLTENPHASYDITIDGTTELLNPSPPAPPSDYWALWIHMSKAF